jgi:uncharacterized membrane protein required for colicin V production
MLRCGIVWRFNWVDLLVLVIVGRAGYVGTLRGIWVEVLRLVRTVGAVVVAASATTYLVGWIEPWAPGSPAVTELAVFIVLTAAAFALLMLVTRLIIRGVTQNASGLVNQGVGGALGLCTGLLYAGAAAWALHSLPVAYLRDSVATRSFSGAWVLQLFRM